MSIVWEPRDGRNISKDAQVKSCDVTGPESGSPSSFLFPSFFQEQVSGVTCLMLNALMSAFMTILQFGVHSYLK